MAYDPAVVKDLMGLGFSSYQAVKLGELFYTDSVLAAGSTTTSGFLAGDLLESDGTKVQAITGGATTLSRSSRGLLGLAYVTDTRLVGGTPGNITLALADAGKKLYQPGADATPRVVTIPLQSNVPFAETETIPFTVWIGGGGLVFTPAGGVTLSKADGTGSVATATAAAASNGVLTHITGDLWEISGGSLS